MHQMNHIRFYVIIITTRAYNPLIRGNEVYHRTPYADVPERTAPSKLSAFQDLPQFKNLEQHPDLKHYQQSKACNGFETAVPVVGDCAILDIENDELYKQVDNATRSNLDKNKHRVGDLIIQPGKEDNDNAEIIVLRSPGTHASITRAESNRT
ncbi:hypothetical protein RCL_jg25733.t1 [Rhizophagus clarus]|uniref:Uncharacterized protein n=1 Tax=Rhizophagus clarus TaxID=94130 RepID=A0A8H3LTE2_9GLOM|nr:hypothetical protein RCL_jg25733.t1 [Rhizophagus clarus]